MAPSRGLGDVYKRQALRQEYGLPELTPQAVDALRVAEVADLAREMTRRRRRWQVLFTTGD